VLGMTFSSCGNYLLSAGEDQQLRLWDANSGQLLPTHFEAAANHLPASRLPYEITIASFSHAADDVLMIPAGATMAGRSNGSNGSNGSNDNNSSNPSTSSSSSSGGGGGGGSTNNPNTAADTHNGDLLLVPIHSAAGSGSTATSQDIATLEGKTHILRGHVDQITSIAHRKPYQQLITAARDGMVYLWDAPTMPIGSSINRTSDTNSRCNHQLHNNMRTVTSGRYDYQLNIHDPTQQQQQQQQQQSTQHVAVASAAALPVPVASSNSSGDDWSDDENDTTHSAAGALSAAVRSGGSRKRHRHDESAAMPTPAPAAVSTSRSFVPPIIQQYLQEADRASSRTTTTTTTATTTTSTTNSSSSSRSSSSSNTHTAPSRSSIRGGNGDNGIHGTNTNVSTRSVIGETTATTTATGSRSTNQRTVNATADRYDQWVKSLKRQKKKPKPTTAT